MKFVLTFFLFLVFAVPKIGLANGVVQEGAAESDVVTQNGEPEKKSEKEKKKTNKKKEVKVDINSALRKLESVFKRRMALVRLVGLNKKNKLDSFFPGKPSEIISSVKSTVRNKRSQELLTYHYIERIKNSEQRILNQLRKDKFEGIQDVLEYIQNKEYPSSVPYANLMNTLEMNFKYACRLGFVEDKDFIKEVSTQLSEQTNRVQGTAGHSLVQVAEAFFKGPGSISEDWFSGDVKKRTFAFKALPVVNDFPLIDLNKVDQKGLLQIPKVSKESADAILKYRKKFGSFQGPEELRLVKELPKYLIDPLRSLTHATHIVKKKKWTLMVFLNGANNLEPFAIGDINEMELVGSTDQVNVVVEIARMEREKDGAGPKRPNPSYFRNPYLERGKPQFYYGAANTPGVERYYVLKDRDEMKIQSVIKQRVDGVDHGSSNALESFGKWATESYPADHYALVVWNHGSGWTGISYDDNTHHGLDLPEVRQALKGIAKHLEEKQGKKKIDIVDFDACLMATYEVVYELHPFVDFFVASQELEPGEGLPYDKVLQWLTMYPESQPVSFAKALVDKYVRSYAPGGSQTGGGRSSYSETLSAIRMANVPKMKDHLEEFASILLKRPELLGTTADEIFSESRNFSGRLVDIQDLCRRFAEKAPKDKDLQAVYQKIKDLIAYPEEDYKLVNEVVVKRRRPGSVIWGYNGWLSPPKNMSPYRHNYKLAKVPLVGPDKKGYYKAKIKFPPVIYATGRNQDRNEFIANSKIEKQPETDLTGKAENANSKKVTGPQVVKEINYRFSDESTKHTFKDFENLFITSKFPESSLMLAEGHLIRQNNAHGLTIYFPSYLGYNKEYRRLQFAQDSQWVRLCEKFPLKSLDKVNSIGLLGISHLNKSTRKKLAKIVVKEAFEKQMRELRKDQSFRNDLKKLQKNFTSIEQPKRFGEDWHGVLKHFQEGVIILDGTDGQAPSSRNIARHLKNGGNVLIASPNINRNLWDQPLFRNTLGLDYDQLWDDSYQFVRKQDLDESDQGDSEGKSDQAKKKVIPFEVVPVRKGSKLVTFKPIENAEGVEPWLILSNSKKVLGLKIYRTDKETGKTFKAIVLGFYLNDILDKSKRQSILKEALEFLQD